jgi:hypothetical protein
VVFGGFRVFVSMVFAACLSTFSKKAGGTGGYS